MASNSAPHDFAGDLEKGHVPTGEASSPALTNSGSTLAGGCDSNSESPPPSPGSGEGKLSPHSAGRIRLLICHSQFSLEAPSCFMDRSKVAFCPRSKLHGAPKSSCCEKSSVFLFVLNGDIGDG